MGRMGAAAHALRPAGSELLADCELITATRQNDCRSDRIDHTKVDVERGARGGGSQISEQVLSSGAA